MRRLLGVLALALVLSCVNMEVRAATNPGWGEEEICSRSEYIGEITRPFIGLVNRLESTYDIAQNEDGSVTITATLENEHDVRIVNINAEIIIIGDGELISKQGGEDFESISAGETKTVSWNVKANSGSVRLYVSTYIDGQVTIDRVGRVISARNGWISGDMHTHSIHSDGTGTIFENFAEANRQGMDFIAITDHNNSRGWANALAAGARYNIIPIRGNEYTRYRTHALFINANRERNYRGLPPVEAVHAFRKDSSNGLVYVAHPFEYNEDSWQRANAWGADIDGLEVWLGWYSANHISQIRSRRRWDELNNEGRRLFGIAATDAHSSQGVGTVFTTVYAGQMNLQGIIDAQRAGHMYGSNGPVIDFRVGSNMMGDVVDVSEAGRTVTVDLSGEYIEDFDRVLLIKNGVVIDTRVINDTSFNYSVDVFVQPGDFLRMEAFGVERNGRTHTYNGRGPAFFVSAPFAFSNPIFFGENHGRNTEENTTALSGQIRINSTSVARGDTLTHTLTGNLAHGANIWINWSHDGVEGSRLASDRELMTAGWVGYDVWFEATPKIGFTGVPIRSERVRVLSTIQRGWISRNGQWSFYNDNGQRHIGWLRTGGNWYFMNSSGVMQTGWLSRGGQWYFLNPRSGASGHTNNLPQGAMRTGWVRTGGQWYFLNPRSGASGHTRNLPYGAMRSGWLSRSGRWYFLNPRSGASGHTRNLPHGAMRSGWVQVGGSWFFMNNSGRMQTGWTRVGNNWFFMNNSGRMQTGRVSIDGVQHRFNANGIWQGRY